MKPSRKPQKKKDYSVRYNRKWHGYYMEDMDCKMCRHYVGKRKGCKLDICFCEDEKLDAIKHGRIKRAKSIGRWDA